MARSYFNYGPYLQRRINGVTSDSTTRAWTVSTYQGGYSRPKPTNLLASQTNHSASETRKDTTTVTLPNGNVTPVTDYIAAGNSTSSVAYEIGVADSRAASNLRQVIKDMTWDTAVFGAELGKTLGFFLDTGRHLVQAYRAARRGDVLGLSELYHRYDYRGKRRPPAYKRVANVWLQWRYAVRPALMDLNDALTELYSSGLRPVILTARGQGQEYVDTVLQSGTWNQLPLMKRRTGYVRVEYGAYYTLSSGHSLTRLGLTNLPALLWELTPYSFVVDNVLPIGTYLSGLDATYGCTFLAGYKVEAHNWGEHVFWGNGQDHATIKSYSRSPITSFPGMPPPAFQRPKGDLPSKVVDVIALLSQVVKRGG